MIRLSDMSFLTVRYDGLMRTLPAYLWRQSQKNEWVSV